MTDTTKVKEEYRLIAELFWGFHRARLDDPSLSEMKPYIQPILTLIDKYTRDTIDKSIKVMQDIMMENFHYRMMFGEVRDPDGKIDVMKEFVRYQELEPERKKFIQYIEEVKAKITEQKDGE